MHDPNFILFLELPMGVETASSFEGVRELGCTDDLRLREATKTTGGGAFHIIEDAGMAKLPAAITRTTAPTFGPRLPRPREQSPRRWQ